MDRIPLPHRGMPPTRLSTCSLCLCVAPLEHAAGHDINATSRHALLSGLARWLRAICAWEAGNNCTALYVNEMRTQGMCLHGLFCFHGDQGVAPGPFFLCDTDCECPRPLMF